MGNAAGKASRIESTRNAAVLEDRPLSPVVGPRQQLRFARSIKANLQTGCLEWQGRRNDGYGIFSYDGREVRAHRLAWVMRHEKPIPTGKQVCHTCDNRSCVNPDHLFLGDPADNMADMAMKQGGKTVPTDSLSKQSILSIRAGVNAGEPIRDIASRHRITPTQVHQISTRDDWPWLI